MGRPVRQWLDGSWLLLGRRIALCLLLALAAGCGAAPAVPSQLPPTATPAPSPVPPPTPVPTVDSGAGLTAEQIATLGSLVKVDDYPLYTMRYVGGYDQLPPAPGGLAGPAVSPWACSLFAALGNPEAMHYGRNFDWEHSPALLLFTDPPDGYASVAMVDIAYLGFSGGRAGKTLDLSLEERLPLLYAPLLPFDGMNEAGLAVGMAAVPEERMPMSPGQETIDSLLVIRRILDHAATVDEAVAILGQYNIDWDGGPPLHYLIADASGRAAVVEFYQGEMTVLGNEQPWHVATNFLLAAAGASPQGQCWRYDRISQRLEEAAGRLSAAEGMELLAEVSQEGTQWSVVYALTSAEVTVSMGRQYDDAHTFPCVWPAEPR